MLAGHKGLPYLNPKPANKHMAQLNKTVKPIHSKYHPYLWRPAVIKRSPTNIVGPKEKWTEPIALPDGIDFAVDLESEKYKHLQILKIGGPLGMAHHTLPTSIHVSQTERALVVDPDPYWYEVQNKTTRDLWGLTFTRLNQMIYDTQYGAAHVLKIFGVGYRFVWDVEDEVIGLWVGRSHIERVPIPPTISVNIPDELTCQVFGPCRHAVHLFSKRIRAVHPPERYKGKGVRFESEEPKLFKAKKK